MNFWKMLSPDRNGLGPRCKLFWKRGGVEDGLVCDRVEKAELMRVKHEPRGEIAFLPINWISKDRRASVFEVHSDLVSAARVESALH